MRLKFLVAFLFLFIGFVQVHAQWDAQISQYWRVKPYFNPSFAGESDSIQLTALHRQQWMGIEGAPKTFIVTANMPIRFLDRKHGVGVMMMTESIGLFSNSTMSGQYVYKKKIKKNLLNIGAQINVSNLKFNTSDIKIPEGSTEHEVNDEAVPTGTGESSSTFDLGFGASWIGPKYYVGFSVSHLMEPEFSLDETRSTYLARTYYLTGGYNIFLKNPLFVLQPSVLVKSDLVATQIDLTGRIIYNKMFNGGISWRKDDGFVISLGATFYSFDVGYSYDLSTSAISKASSGSHEVFLRYSMPFSTDKAKKNKHKSVRIL